jgi:aspartate/methionine/tyrosine aminotransferase
MARPQQKISPNTNRALRSKRSEYMEWAKTCSQARFNLATSGVMNVSIAEFPLRLDQLEITSSEGYGYGPLLERLARHTSAPQECIVATAGTSMANHLAMAALLDPGDEVLLERPTYGLLLDVANYLHAPVKRFERRFENGFAVEPSEIERQITGKTRLVVLSNLHNPSGALIPLETLRAIGEMALRNNLHVLIDEVYLEMLFDGRAPLCFPIGQKLETNPFIVTSSLTKAYGLSGLRCGWILASPDLAHRLWRLNDLFSATGAHATERMSVMAFHQIEKFRARTRALLEPNRALLDEFLDSRSDLAGVRPPGGTVIFPRLTHGDAEAFCRLLREKYETTVVPGRFFEMPQHFRIGIGGETATLRDGLERMGAALDEFGRGARRN